MATVRVWVKFVRQVPYVITVKNPKDIGEIRQVLKETDPSNWETDPDFYESHGSEWKENVTKDLDVEILPDKCPECGKPIETVSVATSYIIEGCPIHREFDRVKSL